MGKRKEGGIDSGERAAMDAENVRKCARERGCGLGHGASVPGVVCVAGMLVSRDADGDVQEGMSGPAVLVPAVRALQSGVDADAGLGRDCDGEKRRAVPPPSIQRSVGDDDNDLNSASNLCRSSFLLAPRLLFLLTIFRLARIFLTEFFFFFFFFKIHYFAPRGTEPHVALLV